MKTKILYAIRRLWNWPEKTYCRHECALCGGLVSHYSRNCRTNDARVVAEHPDCRPIWLTTHKRAHDAHLGAVGGE